jgi:hypothetical protein
MVTQIIMHLLPHEIDWFEEQVDKLIQASTLIKDTDTILLDVTLNLNLVEWERSKIEKQFFIDKFNSIEKLITSYETEFTISDNGECLGCNDKRRDSIKNSKSDTIIFLDTDLLFKTETLPYILEAAKTLPNEYFILSPQLPKMWDNSWDVLVNSNFINEPPSHEAYRNCKLFEGSQDYGEVKVKPMPTFKFAGGMFNLFSTNLLKKIGIPEKLGPYGLDDTFIMYASSIIQQTGHDIVQYVLEGIVVKEDLPHSDIYSSQIEKISNQKEYRENANTYFKEELDKFLRNLLAQPAVQAALNKGE